MNNDIHGLIGAYALDAVTDQERREFEQHLHDCADCRDELAGLREAATVLGAAAREDPPMALRESVLTGIAATRPLPPIVPPDPGQESPRPRHLTGDEGPARREKKDPSATRWWTARRWLAAAAAAAAIVIGGLTWHPWTGSRPTPVPIAQQVLQAPDVHRHVKHVDGATVAVSYSPKLGKSVLKTTDMDPAPAGHTYQLWYMTAAGKATGAGFVVPSRHGTSSVLLKGNANKADLVGITIEPDGGSPQPTTKPIMTVKLTT